MKLKCVAIERDRSEMEDALERQAEDHTKLTKQILTLTHRGNQLTAENIQLKGVR